MALRILLADPDEEWLEATYKFFKDALYEVDRVTTGKEAQLNIYNNKYFAVVLNYGIQNHSGATVLRFIKSNAPGLRLIVLFNGQAAMEDEGLDEDKMKLVGITDYLVKPFSNAQLAELLEGHQSFTDLMNNLPKREGVSAEVSVEESDDKFTGVKIEEFYSSKAVLFDVFIRLGAARYVKILHSGDVFSKERIDKYKNEKGVTHLYFKKTDRKKYVQFSNYLAQKVMGNTAVKSTQKLAMLKNTTEKFVEEVMSVGVKPQVIDQGKEICNTVFRTVEENKDLHAILRDYQDFDPNAFSHAYLVTLFSSCIIKQFDWQSKSTIENTAMACMFHDIGKMKLPPEIAAKEFEDMSDTEKEMYRKHPELGAEMVDGNRLISNSIKQIILQHHEYYDGTGYPYGLKGSKILTLANITCLSNDFVHMIIREKLKPVEGLRKMLGNQDVVKRYNSMILENFIKVFVAPGKIVGPGAALPSNSSIVPRKAS